MLTVASGHRKTTIFGTLIGTFLWHEFFGSLNKTLSTLALSMPCVTDMSRSCSLSPNENSWQVFHSSRGVQRNTSRDPTTCFPSHTLIWPRRGSCELCQYSALKGIEGNLEHEAPSALFMGANPEMSGWEATGCSWQIVQLKGLVNKYQALQAVCSRIPQ